MTLLAGIPDRVRQIICEEAARANLNPADILRRSQCKVIVRARQAAIHRAAAVTNLSLKQIGRLFRRDHTTVGFAIMRHAQVTGVPAARGISWRRA